MICQTAPQAMHVSNFLQCLQCSLTFCQSCVWGCPRCGFGKEEDRRVVKREAVELPITTKEIEE